MRTKLKGTYEPPEKVTPEMERGVERAFAILFEMVMQNRQAKAIKSEIKINKNDYEYGYTKISK